MIAWGRTRLPALIANQRFRGRYVFDLGTAVNALCFVHEQYDLKRFEALMAKQHAGTLLLSPFAGPISLRHHAPVTPVRRSSAR